MSFKARIFIVDDEASLRRALRRLLVGEGYEVECFGGAEEFLARLTDQDRGCLLLDIAMPGMDGFELLRRAGPRAKAIPAVLMTGHGDDSTSDRAREAGAVRLLQKPFTRDVLLSAIQEALARAA